MLLTPWEVVMRWAAAFAVVAGVANAATKAIDPIAVAIRWVCATRLTVLASRE
jgi:hypothetical protein